MHTSIPCPHAPQVPSPKLPDNPQLWPIDDSSLGSARKLIFDNKQRTWSLTTSARAEWHAPLLSENQTLYTYANGAYALYEQNLMHSFKGFSAQMGLLNNRDGHLRRVLIDYAPDGWVHSLTLEQYGLSA